jgi:hypothetical protein
MKSCSYCSSNHFENGKCQSCGAPNSAVEIEASRDIWKGEPFAYNGFIVWPIVRGWEGIGGRSREYHFYLGDRLVEIVEFSDEIWRELFVRDSAAIQTNPMKLVWELFLVACGDEKEYIQEVAHYNGSVRPARLTTRVELLDPPGTANGLSWDEVEALRQKVYA